MPPSLESILELATSVARGAGEILLSGADGLKTVNSTSLKDVKLQADLESESYIRKRLSEGTGFPIIGEEEGGDSGLTAADKSYWVVDPLDGTYNYLRDIPMTCVSVGLMKGMDPVLGVIFDFNRNEMFSGCVDRGLTINGEIWHSQWSDSRSLASLSTGFPAGRDYESGALAAFLTRVQTYKKIRMIGSAALSVAYVAAGRIDAHYEEGTRLWDVAAGLALVKAAGGVVSLEPIPGKKLAYNVWAAGRADLIS